MLRHQRRQLALARQAEPLSQYRRHPCLAALPFQPLKPFPIQAHHSPQTLCMEYRREAPLASMPGWVRTTFRRWLQRAERGACSQPKGWPGAGEGCRAAPCQQRERTKRGKENELKERARKRGNAYRKLKQSTLALAGET